MSTDTALETLLQRMNQGGDFPALSHTISELNKAVSDENGHSSALTEIILRDVSLTNKLLRLVNAAYYGSFSVQPISTISRAVVILGLDAVRDAAISLLLFEHLENHAQAEELKAEAVDSFFCGTLGRMLASSAGVRDSEEAFISALFRNLGRLMARFHFYEETVQVAERMEADQLSEAAAARVVLGVDYEQLGLAIAKQWHFAPNILHAITPVGEGPVRAASSLDGRLRVVANLAQELHQTYARNLPPDQQRQAINALCERYKDAAKVSVESLAETAHKAAQTVQREAHIIRTDARRSPLMQRLLKPGQAEQEAAAGQEAGEEEEVMAGLDTSREGESMDPTSILAQGMQDLTSLILGEYQLSDVLKMVAELFYRSGSFDRVLVSTLDRGSQCLLGRVAFGPNAEALRRAFRIPLSFAPDVFHAALSKGQDILISDATADNIRDRIPPWYRDSTNAHAFLLLPIAINGKSVAMLYADRQAQPLELTGQMLGMLKALRNQATLAIRQKL
ncbi:MAG: HDOD domain-containing protein [Thiobacillus sp.]|nr:HDOD domain-containing protein [Thiobacillus sp.]